MTPPKTEPPMKNYTIKLPDPMIEAIKDRAESEGVSASEIVRHGIRLALEGWERSKSS